MQGAILRIDKMENPGALAGATGAEELRLKSEQPYILGGAIATLGLEKTLRLKPKGWYHIEPEEGWIKVTIHRPGHSEEVVLCLSPGHANRVRQELSDQGLAGLIEGAD